VNDPPFEVFVAFVVLLIPTPPDTQIVPVDAFVLGILFVTTKLAILKPAS